MSKRVKEMTPTTDAPVSNPPPASLPSPAEAPPPPPTFLESDLEDARKFGALFKKAKFDFTIDDVIECHRLLVWYNRMVGKIGDHIMEVKKVSKPGA